MDTHNYIMDIRNSVIDIRDLILIVHDKLINRYLWLTKYGYSCLNNKDIQNFHLSVGDANAREAKGE